MAVDMINQGVNRTTTVNNNVTSKPKTDEKKPVPKTAIGAGLVGLAALASVGMYIATRGKAKIKITPEQETKINELIQSGKLDTNTAKVFKSLHGLEGEVFIKEAYKQIAKLMGYDKHTCPALRTVNKNSTSSSSYRYITIDKSGYATKEDKISVIRHELEHFRQKELVYRALGKDKAIDIMVQPSINKLKYNDEFCIKKLGKKYSDLTEKEIQRYKDTLKKKYGTPDRFDKMEELLQKRGKISKDSPEYLEAQKIYQASMEYISPSALVNEPLTAELIDKMEKTNPTLFELLQNVYQKYRNNLLEVEANKQGFKLKDMYKEFCKEIS